MITKGIIRTINKAGNRCIVRMPLFETASSSAPVEAEALISITPGFYNNLFVGDIVFVSFEENALEKPIILGKLYKGISSEALTKGGAGILDTLKVYTTATIPAATTHFVFKPEIQEEYTDMNTPKKMADYIKWLEKITKKFLAQIDLSFRCFKNWTQWQLRPENVEIDDGNLDDPNYIAAKPLQYQEENAECEICGNECTKRKKRQYLKIDFDIKYPNT
jgi:hypothetical protein